MKTTILKPLILALTAASLTVGQAATKQPNILMIMTDDVGYWNVGAYSHGMMGVPTPNIDRLAKEGILFTDHYAQLTCTPGRAAFITGQLPIPTGLTTVGMAGSPVGLACTPSNRLPRIGEARAFQTRRPTPPRRTPRGG